MAIFYTRPLAGEQSGASPWRYRPYLTKPISPGGAIPSPGLQMPGIAKPGYTDRETYNFPDISEIPGRAQPRSLPNLQPSLIGFSSGGGAPGLTQQPQMPSSVFADFYSRAIRSGQLPPMQQQAGSPSNPLGAPSFSPQVRRLPGGLMGTGQLTGALKQEAPSGPLAQQAIGGTIPGPTPAGTVGQPLTGVGQQYSYYQGSGYPEPWMVWNTLGAPGTPANIPQPGEPIYAQQGQVASLTGKIYGALPGLIGSTVSDIEKQKKEVLDLLDAEKGKTLNQMLARLGSTGALSQQNADAIALAVEAQYAAKKAAMAAELEQQKIQNEIAAAQALGQLAESQGNLALKSWAQQYQAWLETRNQALNEQRAMFEMRSQRVGDVLSALYDLGVIMTQFDEAELMKDFGDWLAALWAMPELAPVAWKWPKEE